MTIVKRLRTKRSADELAIKAIQLRQSGRSAWVETDHGVNILCVRVEVISACTCTIINPRDN